jgi:hypothetical protein
MRVRTLLLVGALVTGWIQSGHSDSLEAALIDLKAQDWRVGERGRKMVVSLAQESATTRSNAIADLEGVIEDGVKASWRPDLVLSPSKDQIPLSNAIPDSVTRAMYALGELRATQSVDVLVRYIGFPLNQPELLHMGSGLMRKGIRKSCPATDALIRIGDPAVNPVIARLAETDSMIEMRAGLSVLVALLGKEQTITRLTQAKDPQTNLKNATRLQQAIEILINQPNLFTPEALKEPEKVRVFRESGVSTP